MSEEKFGFQAEVGKILDIVANSLYSEKEVFLRELVSNASDACDKLRYAALTQPDLTADGADLKIVISIDKKAKTLSIADNGVGMSREELIENLGTIARSGTANFLDQLSGDADKDMSLIGQFGVGFYSTFMVADRVEVVSRRAGEKQAWRWTSDGHGEFTVAEFDEEEAPGRGTRVTAHLKKDAKEYLESERLTQIVKKYSDHIGLPIVLESGDGDGDGDGEKTLNTASALWTRPKKDISEEQYREFYRHVGHAFDEPWTSIHFKAEGKIEYTGLLFVPKARPFDLFDPQRRTRVKLYVKRVFITDDCPDLMPPYLRFLSGIVDSEDLPLNISREMLQHNPLIARIRTALVKRVLGELKKKSEKAPDDYAEFWENFGPVMKEGIYEDTDRRDDLLALARFRSTASDGLTALSGYLGRMKDGQEHIYYIAGEDAEALKSSPQLEGFVSRGLEVLILTDPVDEFWIPSVGMYEDKSFRSVTRGTADLEKFTAAEDDDKADDKSPAETPGVDHLIALMKLELKDAVKDVRVSARLTDSAVCLVADETDMDINLERLLKQHRQLDEGAKRILEINAEHTLIRKLAERAGQSGAATELADAAHLLLDQARIVEGEPPPDPAAFSRRLAGVMQKGLAV
jgi:molecular chaperone HtpG